MTKRKTRKRAPAVPKSEKVLMAWEISNINGLLKSMLEKLEKAPWHPAGYSIFIETCNQETGEVCRYVPLNFRQAVESLDFLLKSNPLQRIVINLEKESEYPHHTPGL